MHGTLYKAHRVTGFTLLEALVVMALLGVLLSLAAPALSSLRQQHRLQAEAQGFSTAWCWRAARPCAASKR